MNSYIYFYVETYWGGGGGGVYISLSVVYRISELIQYLNTFSLIPTVSKKLQAIMCTLEAQ